MNKPTRDPDIGRDARARSRRAFLSMGTAATAGFAGWTWLRSQEGGVEWPIRRVLGGNERIAEAYFSARNLAPTFDQSRVDSTTRRNGDVGLGEDFDSGAARHKNRAQPRLWRALGAAARLDLGSTD
jgi:hypothetical protein